MDLLITERLAFISTPLTVLTTRLTQDDFVADVAIGDQTFPITFPPEWPGDAIVLLPGMIAGMRANPNHPSWEGTIIALAEKTAIGMVGCKGEPDAEGSVEIGYGINPTFWNRGYGTEIVSAFTVWLLAQPPVRRVTAECRVDNIGSIRVLEKAGFVRIGSRVDAEDGPLILWERLP